MLRHLEVVVDKWPIGPQNQMHTMGQRFFIDGEAARILVGMGKAKYVDEQLQSRVMTTETSEPLVRTKRKYNRRDMKARD
jgi:hypothetical protein